MDTKTFLQTILPSSGVKYVMRLKPRPNNPKGDASIHYIAPDAEEAAELILNLDRKFGITSVYFRKSCKCCQFCITACVMHTHNCDNHVNSGGKAIAF